MKRLLLSLVMLLVACGEPEPVRIGFVGGLSNRVADLGIAGRNGAQLAIEEWNARGGVDGRPLELLVRDDEQKPEVARRVLAELIDLKVEAVIGPMTSSMALVMAPIADERGVVLVSPTVTTQQLTGRDDHFFRVINDTSVYGRRNAEYRYASLGHRSVVVVYDQRNAGYSEDWLKSFTEAFTQSGGQVVGRIPFYSSSDLRFSELARKVSELARKVMESGADSVQIIASALDAAQLIQQLRKLGSELPIATSEWAATEQLLQLAGAAAEGVITAQFFDRDSTLAAYRRFRDAYQRRFGSEPGFAGVAGYDAATVVLKALAGRHPGETLKAAILRIGTFDGVQGSVTLDGYGDARRQTYITEVRDGQFRRAD